MMAIIRPIGGPTAVIRISGRRLLTDPTFSAPGDFRSASGARLVKTAGPALGAEELGPIDAVLLSHEQHPDNLDDAGRRYVKGAPLVLTTPDSAARLGPAARGLVSWEHVDLPGDDRLRVTAVPARHGPEGAATEMGQVTGFVLTGPGSPTVYVSGDNASLDAVQAVADRFGPVEVAVLFAGAARSGALNNALLTLDSAGAAEAARILDAQLVVPVHFEQWRHLGEGADALHAAFAAAGLDDRLALPPPGDTVEYEGSAVLSSRTALPRPTGSRKPPIRRRTARTPRWRRSTTR